MFCSCGPNLVILAWTRDKLSRGQASAYRTHRQTDAANDNTRRPKLASGKNDKYDLIISNVNALYIPIARFMGPTCVLSVPCGPHVDHLNLAIWVSYCDQYGIVMDIGPYRRIHMTFCGLNEVVIESKSHLVAYIRIHIRCIGGSWW